MSNLQRLWDQCEQDRLNKTHEFRDEAERWKKEGDMYGWNFHQGKSSGTVEASFIYNRMEKALPAIDEMASLLRVLRNTNNEETINSTLLKAGYEI